MVIPILFDSYKKKTYAVTYMNQAMERALFVTLVHLGVITTVGVSLEISPKH